MYKSCFPHLKTTKGYFGFVTLHNGYSVTVDLLAVAVGHLEAGMSLYLSTLREVEREIVAGEILWFTGISRPIHAKVTAGVLCNTFVVNGTRSV